MPVPRDTCASSKSPTEVRRKSWSRILRVMPARSRVATHVLRKSSTCRSPFPRSSRVNRYSSAPLPTMHLWLANCYFPQDYLGFPILLPFFDAQSGRSFHPFDCRPGSVARSWWRPYRSRGIASPQTPTPDRESLPATIAESIRGGPHLRRLDGALGASNSSAPFRNCTEALDTARPCLLYTSPSPRDGLL